MKIWLVLFLLLLAVGFAWGLARDLFSRPRAALAGTIVGIDTGNPIPKWLPATPPRYKVRLPDGRTIDVAAKGPLTSPAGATLSITEWVTPWGQVWYTQRD